MRLRDSEELSRKELEAERGSRRLRMEQLERPGFGWSCVRNSILFLILALESGGIGWCALSYLPRIETSYLERIEPQPLPSESDQIFDLGHWMASHPLVMVAAGLLLLVLEGIALATRRWPIFDAIYFVGIVALGLGFLYAYVSLALPLSMTGGHPPAG